MWRRVSPHRLPLDEAFAGAGLFILHLLEGAHSSSTSTASHLVLLASTFSTSAKILQRCGWRALAMAESLAFRAPG